MNRDILEAAIARVASSDLKNHLLLRGSFLTSHWVGPGIRKCDDLDFLALESFKNPSQHFARFVDRFRSALAQSLDDHVTFLVDQMTEEIIFEETLSPGLRFQIPFESDNLRTQPLLQIDFGFNDPLPEPQPTFEFQTAAGNVSLTGSSPELAFAWKLHGLVERDGLGWRAKDLADLWLLQNQFQFDQDKLSAAIKVAFESRDGPLWRLDRLIRKQVGKSSGSRRRYARFLKDFTFEGEGYPNEIHELVEAIANKIEPTITKLKKSINDFGPFEFATKIAKDELLSASQGSRFRKYQYNENVTIVRERSDSKPLPLHEAATKTKHRELNLQREARGITFNAQGNVIARPYADFGWNLTVDDVDRQNKHGISELDFRNAIVLEKLDGSLVFPTPDESDGSWYLRTRRGRSDIADNARKFAGSSDSTENSNYLALIEHCLEKSQTPVFEWCSRSRLIVFDHPQDRLVLTGIRANEQGSLMDYDPMEQLAKSYRVEITARLKKPESLRELVEQTSKLTESEGCVLRLQDGRQFKIKSERYLRLHRAIEGPTRDRARWHLWAIGAEAQLNHCSTDRGLNLDDYLETLRIAVAKYAKRIEDDVQDFVAKHESQNDREAIRKRLAQWLDPKPALESRLAFLAFDGACLETTIKQVITDRCESNHSFLSLATKLNGPLLRD